MHKISLSSIELPIDKMTILIIEIRTIVNFIISYNTKTK